MKASEIRELSTNELQEQVKMKKNQLFSLRFQQATGELDDTSQIRKVRKDVARMLTELTARTNNEATAVVASEQNADLVEAAE
jgi:large subunit ribosomal protein L29